MERPRRSQRAARTEEDRVILQVPFEEKDSAKALGAKWDGIGKTWWTTRSNLAENQGLARWRPTSTLPECDCPVAPWEHCVHTLPVPQGARSA